MEILESGDGINGHLQGLVNISDNGIEPIIVDDVSGHIGFDGLFKDFFGSPDILIVGLDSFLTCICYKLGQEILVIQVAFNIPGSGELIK